MDVPLRCPGDVHACRLRHVGDWVLPCQERIQRSDEELGERFLIFEQVLCFQLLSCPDVSGRICLSFGKN